MTDKDKIPPQDLMKVFREKRKTEMKMTDELKETGGVAKDNEKPTTKQRWKTGMN